MPRLSAVAGVLGLLLLGGGLRSATGQPIRYRLTAGSGYQWGCLAGPCDCAVHGPVPVIGTFLLTEDPPNPFYVSSYRLTEIVWYVYLPEGRTRLTGEGTYRVSGQLAVVQQLEVTLTSPDGTVRHFDSGQIAGGGPPIDIQTYVTGSECVMAGIRVVAEPAPYTVYRLGERSTLVEGCFGGICACPVSDPQPLSGRFVLTPIEVGPSFTSYAVTELLWYVGSGSVPEARGHGLYRIGGDVSVVHQLELDLLFSDSEDLQHLDSGQVPVVGGFPAIDIITETHTLCYNRRADVQARPAGDFNLDGSVDDVDDNKFEDCMTGPAIPQDRWSCLAVDIDGDSDVDQEDFGLFQACVTGAGAAMDPACAD